MNKRRLRRVLAVLVSTSGRQIMAQPPDAAIQPDAAYREGRNAGLALGALSMAALAYINLLSVEKSLLAIALAWIVLSRAGAPTSRTQARWALGIALVHVAIWVGAAIMFAGRLVQLVQQWVHLG
jgi:hypothetical protein